VRLLVSNIYKCFSCWFFLSFPPTTDVAAVLPTFTVPQVKEMARILQKTRFPSLNLRGGRSTLVDNLLKFEEVKTMFDRADTMCNTTNREKKSDSLKVCFEWRFGGHTWQNLLWICITTMSHNSLLYSPQLLTFRSSSIGGFKGFLEHDRCGEWQWKRNKYRYNSGCKWYGRECKGCGCELNE